MCLQPAFAVTKEFNFLLDLMLGFEWKFEWRKKMFRTIQKEDELLLSRYSLLAELLGSFSVFNAKSNIFTLIFNPPPSLL